MLRILKNALNFFRVCVVCKKHTVLRNSLCQICYSLLEESILPYGCINCVERCECNMRIFVPFQYNEITRKLLMQFKYGSKAFYSDVIIKLSLEADTKGFFRKADMILLPIPMSKIKLWQRTYNQSLLMCKSICKVFNLQIASNIFIKLENSTQRGSSRSDRAFNATNTIGIECIDDIVEKHVCIVDDLISTGETINRCIDLCKKHVKSISVFSFVKT